MKIEKFEDIIAWKKGYELTMFCYRKFANCRDFSFRDQLQRACISIMNNIAEGFERKGDKELKRFLFIAKGSCGEVRSMLYVAQELNYVTKEEFKTMYQEAEDISRLLSGFIKKLD